EPRVVVRAAPQRPVELAVLRADRKVVDARQPPRHEAARVEFPVFVAVGAVPLTAVVVALVRKPDADPILSEGPDLLDEAVIESPRPRALQELHDRLASGEELGAVAPDAVRAVGERHAF